jgi:hypothetical protein
MAPYMHLNQKSLASRSNRSGCGPAARRAAAVVPPSATSRPSHEQLVQNLQRAGLAALASVLVAVAPPSAMADLNRFEADAVRWAAGGLTAARRAPGPWVNGSRERKLWAPIRALCRRRLIDRPRAAAPCADAPPC